MIAHLGGVPLCKIPRDKSRRQALAAVRAPLFQAMLAAIPNPDELVKVMNDVAPELPPPKFDERPRFATVADIRRDQAEMRWTWEGWIPAGSVFGLAGYEGSGKTRTGMDIHRRVWRGLPWPDEQPATLPTERPAIWICADGNHDELAEMLPAYGLPDHSVIFPAFSGDPYAGTDIDDPELTKPGGILEQAIIAHAPWIVCIDTLSYATSRDLCDQSVMKSLKAPLVRLAQYFGVSIGLLLHLSREGQALGRRIRGLTRTLMHLECPDPETSSRLRFWVEKSYAKKPPALGLTLGSGGNEYDNNPPRRPEPAKTGRPSTERDKAGQFIRAALAEENNQIGNSLCSRFKETGGSEQTFWRAVENMSANGELVADGGRGTRRQTVLHMNGTAATADRPF
jgi:hypothetical protein